MLTTHAAPPDNAPVLPLWNGPAPMSHGTTINDIPSLTVYAPAQTTAPASAIVICPGGGYGGLAWTHEGTNVAKFFQQRGVVAFILRYRLGSHGYHHPVEMTDVQRALRFVRSHAAEWKIDPHKIGIIGFSAGGHLAATADTHFDAGDPKAADPVDRAGCRPDFAILVYAVISMKPGLTDRGSHDNLLGKNPDPALELLLSNETQVTPQTPPTILVTALDDKTVKPENSRLMYAALQKAGVPTELDEYPHGGHGFGYGHVPDHAPPGWLDKAYAWVKGQGFLP